MTSYQSFNLNTELAKQADAGGRIESTGKYVGVIKSMEFVTSSKNTQGFEINFESDAKEYTTFTIWTAKADGTQLSGVKEINALMACAAIRTLTPTEKALEKYDYDLGKKVSRLCMVAPEMENKRIGLLLQRENYLNKNNEPRHAMKFFASFNAESELMAKEVLERKTVPELLPKALERLLASGDATRTQNNTVPAQNGYAQQNTGYAQPQNNGYGAQASQAQPNDLDDDLPF